MTYASPDERTALTGGLRALAGYLQSSPGVPAPSYASVYTFPSGSDCHEMRAQVDAIADLPGTQARETAGGQHYSATRSFGPVQYRATAICRHAHHDTDRR